MQPPERDFIQQFHECEETAWEKIWTTYYNNLLIYALRFVSDTNDQEDIVTSAFIGLWRNRSRIEHEYNILPYLVASVRNGCLKHLEKQKRINDGLKELALVENFQQATAIQQKWVSDVIDEIIRHIKSLPELEQKVFWLSYVEGLSNEEIAQRLDIAMSTVYNNKSKALNKLREWARQSNLSQDIKYMVLFILLIK